MTLHTLLSIAALLGASVAAPAASTTPADLPVPCRATSVDPTACMRHGALGRLPNIAPPELPPTGCLVPGSDDKCEAWEALHGTSSASSGLDFAFGIATSPGSPYVFAALGTAAEYDYDVVTIAYSRATGEKVWESSFEGPADLHDTPWAITASADGSRVYVAGQADGDAESGGLLDGDLFVLAIDATSGIELWNSTFDLGDHLDIGTALALSADGSTLAVVGTGETEEHQLDAVALGYDAATGAQLWQRSLDRSGGFDAFLSVVPAGPGFVATGTATSAVTGDDIMAVGFGLDGSIAWQTFVDGGANGVDGAFGAAAAGSRVFVAGQTQTESGPLAATIVSIDAASGQRMWLRAHTSEPSVALAIATDGERVYATGISEVIADTNILTLSYTVAGGSPWTKRFLPVGGTYGIGTSIAVVGERVVVGGVTFLGYFTMKGDVTTVAYDAADGAQAWVGRALHAGDTAALLPFPAYVAGDGTRAFTTGTYLNYVTPTSADKGSLTDALIAAYDI